MSASAIPLFQTESDAGESPSLSSQGIFYQLPLEVSVRTANSPPQHGPHLKVGSSSKIIVKHRLDDI